MAVGDDGDTQRRKTHERPDPTTNPPGRRVGSGETPKLQRYLVTDPVVSVDVLPDKIIKREKEVYLASEVDQLIARLREYVQHKPTCRTYDHRLRQCTCGLDKLLHETGGTNG